MNIQITIPFWLYWIAWPAFVAAFLLPTIGLVGYTFAMNAYKQDKAVAVCIAVVVGAITIGGFWFGVLHSP